MKRGAIRWGGRGQFANVLTHRPLIFKRSSLDHAGFTDYDVLSEGTIVGRIYFDKASGSWFWGLVYGRDRDRHPRHGYADSREAAMAAFAKSWAARTASRPAVR